MSSGGVPSPKTPGQWPHACESQLAESFRPLDARRVLWAGAIQDHIAIARQFMLSCDELVERQRESAGNARLFLACCVRTKVHDYRSFSRRKFVGQLADRHARNAICTIPIDRFVDDIPDDRREHS